MKLKIIRIKLVDILLKYFLHMDLKYAAPMEWNELPLSLKYITSLNRFQIAIKPFLLAQVYDL